MQVSGAVTIENANALFAEGLKSSPNSKLVVDFSQIEKVDSAAVSLVLVWLREARRNNVDLHFSNIPPNLMSLFALYGVGELLGSSISE